MFYTACCRILVVEYLYKSGLRKFNFKFFCIIISELPVTTLRAALEEISGRVTDVEYIFEVRRHHVMEDCFKNVTKTGFNPANKIQVHA